MNMKLLAGLAVAITLASAMAFVGLSTKTSQAPAAATPTLAPVVTEARVQSAPNPSATSGTAQVGVGVKAGGDSVRTSVTIAE